MRDLSFPSRRLVSNEDQLMVPRPDVPRSVFRGSWTHKKTFDAGGLYPFLLDEILPGDHMRYDVTAFVRMQPMFFPVMDNQRVDTFFFFVPARILWSDWKKFMGEQVNPADSIAYNIPQLVSGVGGFVVGGLADHFGIPVVGQTGGGATTSVNALPFRAYNLIWDTWFRDENVMNSAGLTTGAGPDTLSWYIIRNRAKMHDYFTSCLPWPQKFTAPTGALSGNAMVRGIGASAGTVVGPTNFNDVNTGGVVAYPLYYDTATSNVAFNFGAVYADLSTATGFSLTAFREAMLTQQWLEQQARGGTRYTEIIRSIFGVESPDARLQRPEYIGGGSSPLNVTAVPQTATGGSGVGSLAAAGTAGGSHTASYAATEHGYIIGLINVRTELSYSQGLRRLWTRYSRTDFYWPVFAGLSEQAVLQREIFYDGSAGDTNVFGYQERYQEYRVRTSEVVGLFRPTSAGNIDEWHLSQSFSPAPTLSTTFLWDSPPMTRIYQAGSATNGQQFLADILIRRDATRPVPAFGVPASLARF